MSIQQVFSNSKIMDVKWSCKPILMEQIIIINAISLGGEKLTIECTCYFKGLPVCGNKEISRTEVWPRDKITNSFHLSFRVLMTINLPSFNRKTICLLDHMGKCGLFWLFVCTNILSMLLHLLRWPKFNLSGGFTAHESVKILYMQVVFKTGEPSAHLLPSRPCCKSPWIPHRVEFMLTTVLILPEVLQILLKCQKNIHRTPNDSFNI